MNRSLDELTTFLERRLRQPLPGRAAQVRCAPRHAYGRHLGPPPFDARAAAVVAILFPRDGDVRVPLILRPDHMADHPSQVCFPGGMIDAGESGAACALREAREELGVDDAAIRILGSLSPIYVFASNFLVTPFVAVASELAFAPNVAEVAEVLELPLSVLLDEAKCEEFEVVRRAWRFRAPCIRLGEHRVWGATSMMLSELRAVLEVSPAPHEQHKGVAAKETAVAAGCS